VSVRAAIAARTATGLPLHRPCVRARAAPAPRAAGAIDRPHRGGRVPCPWPTGIS